MEADGQRASILNPILGPLNEKEGKPKLEKLISKIIVMIIIKGLRGTPWFSQEMGIINAPHSS